MAKKYIFKGSTNFGECTTGPFQRPAQSSTAAVKWYLDTKPRGYLPFMVRVTQDIINNASLMFMFLHNETGADLSGPHTFSRAELDDQVKSYSELPASALAVDLKKEPQNDCGFLLLADKYARTIVPIPVKAGTQIDLMTDSVGDGKYPKGASSPPNALASAIARILSMTREQETLLPPSELEALEQLSSFLGLR